MNKKVINTSLLALVMSTQVTPLIISATEITSSNNAENNVVTSTDGNVSSKSTDATTNVISDDKALDPVKEASTTDATEEASTTDVTEEASTTDVTEEASTTDATEEASTTDATEEASTTDATEEASTTDATEEASTTDAAEEIVNVSLKEVDDTTPAPRSATKLHVDTNGNPIVDLSNNIDKESANAGEKEISFDTDETLLVSDQENPKTAGAEIEDKTSKGLVESPLTAITQESVTKGLKAVNEDSFLVNNKGEIVASDQGLFQTIGGYDHVSYMYQSVDDASIGKNPTSINGGGFDGKYFGTEEKDGKLYAHIKISGFDGYMHIEDIQILPNSLKKAESYFANENGKWVYNEAIDPLTSTEYKKITLGTAENWAQSGVKYYSNDDVTYFTQPVGKQKNTKAVATGGSYFQNLPMRSTSKATASQMKGYLAYKGATASQYYNSTKAFVDAQNTYGVNAAWLFNFANHEGAYGLSTYSKRCNNFFGRGAIDSNPDLACDSPNYGWPTPYDGIMSEALMMGQNYADINYWYYYGTQPGNKISGLNAMYATDPDWGKNQGAANYEFDQWTGNNEEGKYRIYGIRSTLPSYTSSSLSETLKQQGYATPNGSRTSDYIMNRWIRDGVDAYGNLNNPNKLAATPNVVVTQDTGSAFKYQLDQPKNNVASGYLAFNQGFTGTYPNFEGNTLGCKGCGAENYVTKGYSNSNAKYGKTWTDQQAWFPKYDSVGNKTYTIVNDVKAVSPGTGTITPPADAASDLKTSARSESTLKGTKLDLQGIGYLDKVNIAKTTDISNKLNFINDSTNKVYKTVSYASTTKHASELNGYEKGDGRQYDAGWFASPAYKGIDLSTFANGTYRLNLKSCSTKNSSICDSEDVYAGELNGKTKNQYVNGRKYSLYGKSGKVYLKITNISDTTPKIKTNATKFSLKYAKLNIEGAGYLQGVSTPSTKDIQHTLRFVDSNGTTKKTSNMGASVNPSMMDKYETDGRNYNAGNFKPYGWDNYQVDVSSLPKGKYKVYMDIKKVSTGAHGSEQLYSSNLKDHSIMSFSGGKSYELYAVNNRVMLEVDDNTQVKTSAKAASLKGTKMKLEGIGYLYNQTIDQTTDINHLFQFYNYNNMDKVNARGIGAQTKHSIMKNTSNNGKNNDAGYFIPYAKDSYYTNLANLPKGKYKVYLYAEMRNNKAISGHEWLYAGSINGKKYTSTSGGRTYTLSTVNDRVVLTIS